MSDHQTYAPPAAFSSRAHVKDLDEYRALYERAKSNSQHFWSELATNESSLVSDPQADPRLDPASCTVVCGRQNQCLLQLCGPSSGRAAKRQAGPGVGRRAGRSADDHVRRTASSGHSVRHRAQSPGIPAKRSCCDLHADDPRVADRHVGVCATGHHSQRRVRRLLGGSVEDAHSGLSCRGGDHRRWWLAPRQRGEAESRRRRSR